MPVLSDGFAAGSRINGCAAMKKIILAVVVSAMTTSSAWAGGLSEPVLEPEVIVQESKAGKKGGYVIELALLAVLAMIIENN